MRRMNQSFDAYQKKYDGFQTFSQFFYYKRKFNFFEKLTGEMLYRFGSSSLCSISGFFVVFSEMRRVVDGKIFVSGFGGSSLGATRRTSFTIFTSSILSF